MEACVAYIKQYILNLDLEDHNPTGFSDLLGKQLSHLGSTLYRWKQISAREDRKHSWIAASRTGFLTPDFDDSTLLEVMCRLTCKLQGNITQHTYCVIKYLGVCYNCFIIRYYSKSSLFVCYYCILLTYRRIYLASFPSLALRMASPSALVESKLLILQANGAALLRHHRSQ